MCRHRRHARSQNSRSRGVMRSLVSTAVFLASTGAVAVGGLSVGAVASAEVRQPAGGFTAAMAAAAGRYTGQTVTIPPAAPADTFVVNTTSDLPDASKGDGICSTSGGNCSLRAALAEANRRANHAAVHFQIPGTGVHTINVGTQLPKLTNPAGVSINGTTQAGFAPNSDPLVSNARMAIEIVGAGWKSFPGLVFTNAGSRISAFNEVRGLSIYKFLRPIWMLGGSHDNLVVGNFVCTNAAGTAKSKYQIPGNSGVHIQQGAHDIVVGTAAPADRNVLSGCPHHGVATYNYPTRRVTIQNNIVGLNPAGTARLPNQSHGVDINTFTTDTITGGYNPGEGNLVSGNNQAGIEISHGTGTLRNDAVGNRIGTDPSGNAAPYALRNTEFNVRLEGAPKCGSPCRDAGDSLVANNVIVGGGLGGVHVDKGRHDDVIRDNRIGVTLNGTPGGNNNYGVRIENYTLNTKLGPNNEIAFNDNGVQLQSVGSQPYSSVSLPTNFNTITQNSIHDNAGRGIDLAPLNANNTATNADPNTNEGILAPKLTATSVSVTASTCANCTVELFRADTTSTSTRGEGRTYLGSATADAAGTATFTIALPAGTVVTGTTTNPDGSTSEFSKNVEIPTASSENNSPTADFTFDCSAGLTCTFDGSGSSDPDQGDGISSYEWTFGDGGIATGATPKHTYAAAGTYQVTLVVKDTNNAASAPTTKSVSATDSTAGPLADDSFTRVVTDGFGTAPVGGSWLIKGLASRFAVNGIAGTITLPASTSTSNGAYLSDVSTTDADVTGTVSTDQAPVKFGQTFSLVGRQVSNNNEYRVRLHFSGDKSVSLAITKLEGSGTELVIVNDVDTGLTWTANAPYTVRAQVVGTNPTVIRGKAWLTGTPEPEDWLVDTSDTSSALQAAGTVGVRAFLGQAATVATTFSVDDFKAERTG